MDAIIGFAIGGLLIQQWYFLAAVRTATTYEGMNRPTLNIIFELLTTI